MNPEKYDFAYTSSSLRLKEMVHVGKHIMKGSEPDYVNELGAGKSATGKRIYREVKKRLGFLSEQQLNLLVKGSLEIQKHIAFYAVCKTYLFIRDFTVEVLREKYLIFDYEISEGDYISFLRRKQELHHEIGELSESSSKKIKQVTFRILEQAGLINNTKERIIQPQLLQQEVVNAISSDDKKWLKIFLVSDLDLKNYTNQL
ncbi:hypothetical protein C7S20_05595 [Christiangramia fulva]|uniref:DUF1819 domain-containing protein n=1 Tax=Christiangramia fulva TaxID=2126553 RepID=A0A2R3Z3E6_9FLAO|nr:DUF1819 family protein [Christiangramia fulva]AVR44781.1 hypothetical protein C7S20_05595 [Christiangramia fulva]